NADDEQFPWTRTTVPAGEAVPSGSVSRTWTRSRLVATSCSTGMGPPRRGGAGGHPALGGRGGGGGGAGPGGMLLAAGAAGWGWGRGWWGGWGPRGGGGAGDAPPRGGGGGGGGGGGRGSCRFRGGGGGGGGGWGGWVGLWGLEEEGFALAAAAAQRDTGPPRVAGGEAVGGVDGEPGARGADRVAEGDASAVGVDGLGGGARPPGRRGADCAERLVALAEVEVLRRPPLPPERLLEGGGGLLVKGVVRPGDLSAGADDGEHPPPLALGALAGGEDERGGAVGQG